MQCPKCLHIRPAEAANPAWQCPACGIAYHKFKPLSTAAAFKPLSADAPAPHALEDTATWTLVAANVVALAMAFWQGWSIDELMLIYWAQSIIIGASYVLRIRALDRFSTAGFKINNRSVEPTEATKRQTALFFILHFGIFHAVYLAFILGQGSPGLLLDPGFILCTAGFALNHAFSYRYHRNLDQQGEPNIGTLMFTPYIRIIPMHLTIILAQVFSTGAGLLVFGALKTVADACMHVVEHRRLGHKSRRHLP